MVANVLFRLLLFAWALLLCLLLTMNTTHRISLHSVIWANHDEAVQTLAPASVPAATQTDDTFLQTSGIRLSIRHAFVKHAFQDAENFALELTADFDLFLSQRMVLHELLLRTALANNQHSEFLLLQSAAIAVCATMLPLRRESEERQEYSTAALAGTYEILKNRLQDRQSVIYCRLLHREAEEFRSVRTRFQASFGTINKEDLVDIFKNAQRNSPFFQHQWCQM